MLYAGGFNIKNLNDVEVRKQYQIKISKKFLALEISGNDIHVHTGRTKERSQEPQKPKDTRP
jgi:hypothetical protein